MRVMRPWLLQGRGRASIRAKRVVAAARSEENAVVSSFNEDGWSATYSQAADVGMSVEV